MKKKYTLLIVLLSAAVGSYADDTKVRVVNKDGSEMTTTVAEVDRIEFKDGNVVVVPKSGSSTAFPIADIDKIELSVLTAGINEVTADGRKVKIGITSGTISLDGAAENAVAQVYDTAGKLVATARCAAGHAEISLAGRTPGVYIIKVGSFAAKFSVN